jgi:hypothetical protein
LEGNLKLATVTTRDDWATMPFFFNLSGPVGKGYSHSQPDDVMLVQFCFVAITTNTTQPLPAELRPTWSKVRVTGTIDANTQASIDAWQQDRRKRFGTMFETDGIFSVAPPGHTLYNRDTPYSIVSLNYILTFATSSIWPRLDKHPAATSAFGAAVRKSISGTLTA